MNLLSDYLGQNIEGAIIQDVVVSADARTLEGFITQLGYLSFEHFCAVLNASSPLILDETLSACSPIGTLMLDNDRVIGRIVDAKIKDNQLTAFLVERPITMKNASFALGQEFTKRTRTPTQKKVQKSPSINSIVAEKAFTDTPKPTSEHMPIPTQNMESTMPYGIPVRVIADYSFLLGRIVTEDIIVNGLTVIPKGETIVARTVLSASEQYKLFDLTIKSRA